MAHAHKANFRLIIVIIMILDYNLGELNVSCSGRYIYNNV